MNGVDAIRSAFKASYLWHDVTTADLTDEMAAYDPPGKPHSIAELVIHVSQSEDWAIHQLIGGGQTLWEKDGWAERLGLPTLIALQEGPPPEFEGNLADLKPYTEAVRAATAAYLDGLTDADLDQELDMSSVNFGTQRLGDVLTTFPMSNTLAHTGEIAAIKGLQGAQGYPF